MKILSEILSQNVNKQSISDKIFWLEKLVHWVMYSRDDHNLEYQNENIYSAKIKYINLQLNKNPKWRAHFVKIISDILKNIHLNTELAYSGYHRSDSFIQELYDRIKEKLIPDSPANESLNVLISSFFNGSDSSLAVDSINEQVFSDFLKHFEDQETLIENLRKALLEAACRLATNILNLTIQIHKNNPLTNKKLYELYEFKLSKQLMLTHQALESGELTLLRAHENLFNLMNKIEEHIGKSQNFTNAVGINTEMVYRFELQKKQIQRLKILVNLIYNQNDYAKQLRLLISHLIIDTHQQQSLSYFFYENMHHLVERIVQSNSDIGEHYITYNWKQFIKMFFSAAGGGAITVLTVFAKIILAKFFHVGFIKGFLEGTNYSLSFLAIKFTGCTLGTKQPSATAPYIAKALKTSTREAKRTTVALLRTQWAAVLGNVVVVFPISLGISFLLNQIGYPIFTPEAAHESMSSLYFFGPTPIYAAFTGVILFMSSIMSGWFENFYVMNRLDQRLRTNKRLKILLGNERLSKWCNKVTPNVTGISSNITLGFMLGLVPQIIKFFGIPFEVRHVTLSSGQLGAAIPQAINHGMSWMDLLNAISGIAIAGILNIAVSFALALLVASFATDIRFSRLMDLIKWGLKIVFTKPWLLVVPESNDPEKRSLNY